MKKDVFEELRTGLYVPMRSVCLLEAMAALLAEEVLASDLELTSHEREGLVQIKQDEAHHYSLAVKVLRVLPKVDQRTLNDMRRAYAAEHQARWQGSVGRIARLHEDESLVMHFMPVFTRVITEIVPEEGHAFTFAVEQDEPRHHQWGRDVLKRLTDNDEALLKLVRQNRSARGWPIEKIVRGFDSLYKQLGYTT